MIEQLLQPEIQKFINDHLNDQPADLMLKANQHLDWPMKQIVEQIAAKQKARTKLPTWFNQNGMLYPSLLSMEQCSSEQAAEYKASLVSGQTMVDLTGGFGIDTFFLAKRFSQVTHVEINKDLHEIASHNFEVLGVEIETVNNTAETYLKDMESVDLIYIDPARRDEDSKRVVFLEDYSPNVVQMLPDLVSKAQTILIKVSPMLDIKKAISDLKYVSEVHVLAIKNEVKELLFLLRKNENSDPEIRCINLLGEKSENFEFSFSSEENTEFMLSVIQDYLYETNAAILKAGAFKSISKEFQLKKLHSNTHLYTSNNIVDDFPGRVFKIKSEISFNKKRLKKQLDSIKANISVRNYPMTVSEIRKKTGIKEGGSQYIFATTDITGKKVLLCEKI